MANIKWQIIGESGKLNKEYLEAKMQGIQSYEDQLVNNKAGSETYAFTLMMNETHKFLKSTK